MPLCTQRPWHSHVTLDRHQMHAFDRLTPNNLTPRLTCLSGTTTVETKPSIRLGPGARMTDRGSRGRWIRLKRGLARGPQLRLDHRWHLEASSCVFYPWGGSPLAVPISPGQVTVKSFSLAHSQKPLLRHGNLPQALNDACPVQSTWPHLRRPRHLMPFYWRGRIPHNHAPP